MAREYSATEARDQDLAEMIVELAVYYKKLDDEAPPRNYVPKTFYGTASNRV